MKRLIRAIATFLGIVTVSTAAFAAVGSSQGTVTATRIYGDGSVLVSGFYFSGATCSNNGAFVINASHPQFSRLFATVLSAKATGATLSIVAKTDNCWYPEISQDMTTYIYTHP
jgi:hypothetical protein